MAHLFACTNAEELLAEVLRLEPGGNYGRLAVEHRHRRAGPEGEVLLSDEAR